MEIIIFESVNRRTDARTHGRPPSWINNPSSFIFYNGNPIDFMDFLFWSKSASFSDVQNKTKQILALRAVKT